MYSVIKCEMSIEVFKSLQKLEGAQVNSRLNSHGSKL